MLPAVVKQCCYLNVRVAEDSDILHLAGKKSKTKATATDQYDLIFCAHVVSLKDFKFLAISDPDLHHRTKESRLISRGKCV